MSLPINPPDGVYEDEYDDEFEGHVSYVFNRYWRFTLSLPYHLWSDAEEDEDTGHLDIELSESELRSLQNTLDWAWRKLEIEKQRRKERKDADRD